MFQERESGFNCFLLFLIYFLFFVKTIKKWKVEKSFKSTGAVFAWGEYSFDDLGDIVKGFRKIKDDNIIRGMCEYYPIYKLVAWIPLIKKYAQKILIFEKM